MSNGPLAHATWCQLGSPRNGAPRTCTCGAEVRHYAGLAAEASAEVAGLSTALDQQTRIRLQEQDLLTAAYQARDAARTAQQAAEDRAAAWQRDYTAMYDAWVEAEQARVTLQSAVATLQRREREHLGVCHWTVVPGLMSDEWVPLCEGADGARWAGDVPGRHCPFCGRLVTVPTAPEGTA